MSRFNTREATARRRPGGPVKATAATLATGEGAPAYARDAKGELFILGVANLLGPTFYESTEERDVRYAALSGQVAVEDLGWLIRFVRWLRTAANMRSAPLVAAAEGVYARQRAGLASDGTCTGRQLVDAALGRADEPGELIAYCLARYGRRLPFAIKKGAGDAALRLYKEYSLIKYDTPSHGVRFADVLNLCHPRGSRGRAWVNDLFTYALDRRHGRAQRGPAESLATLHAYQQLAELADGDPQVLLDTDRLRAAGMTWQNVLSAAGSKLPKAELWSALIPVMGTEAIIKNLRNFDQEGVTDTAAAAAIARISDPEQVTAARIWPYMLLAAYDEAPSDRWKHPLGLALTACTQSIPELPGRTLVLVDLSQSMTWKTMSEHSKRHLAHAAAVFGVATAARNKADLVGFASSTYVHQLVRGRSLLAEVDAMCARIGTIGGGTDIAGAIRGHFNGHDRVIVFTDEQSATAVGGVLPASVPFYGFNLAGYKPAMAAWGTSNRVQLAGLSDAMFKVLPLVEAGREADWPF